MLERAPWTLGLGLVPGVRLTPGAFRKRAWKLRPTGIFSNSLERCRVSSDVLVLSMTGTSPVTVTSADWAESFIETASSVVFWFSTRLSVRFTVANPESETVTFQRPGVICEKRNRPVVSVTVERLLPRSVETALTDAPGRAAPVSSLTWPARTPTGTTCAIATPVQTASIRKRTTLLNRGLLRMNSLLQIKAKNQG